MNNIRLCKQSQTKGTWVPAKLTRDIKRWHNNRHLKTRGHHLGWQCLYYRLWQLAVRSKPTRKKGSRPFYTGSSCTGGPPRRRRRVLAPTTYKGRSSLKPAGPPPLVLHVFLTHLFSLLQFKYLLDFTRQFRKSTALWIPVCDSSVKQGRP
jgi:hypothetical protein